MLALLAHAAPPPPALAAEDERGWLDVIVDFLKPPQNGAPVEVPLRKTDPPPPAGERPSPPLPAAEPAVAPETPAAPARREGAQPAHAYRAARDLAAELHILREALGAGDPPPGAPLLADRAPVHAYVKTLEIWAKVNEVQRRRDLPAGGSTPIPSREVDAADILLNLEHILREVGTIKTGLGIERAIVPAPLEPAVTHSALHKALADASLALDGLHGGAPAPGELYRHVAAALGEAAPIGEALGVAPGASPAPADGPKRPLDVAQQLLRAASKALDVQARLHMDASRAPALRLEGAAAVQQCHDLAGLVRAELARIGWHLGIDAPVPAPPEPPAGATWDDVFALARALVARLDRLAAAR